MKVLVRSIELVDDMKPEGDLLVHFEAACGEKFTVEMPRAAVHGVLNVGMWYMTSFYVAQAEA